MFRVLSLRRCVPRVYTWSRAFSTAPQVNDGSTHFGFQTVPTSQKEEMVKDVFRKVAGKYDKMNDAMSLGVHRLWKDAFVQTLKPTPGCSLLDVAGGTGDIAFRCIEEIKSSPVFFPRPPSHTTTTDTSIATPSSSSPVFSPPSSVTICDINPNMLEVGKERADKLGYSSMVDPKLSWVVGNAEQLPFPDSSMDAYTIAFGIRNVTNIPAALREAHRVLKRGGRFLCLEFSEVNNSVLRSVYDQYSFNVIPVIGQLVANDMESYQYLVESIRKFPKQLDFARMMEEAGFNMVEYKDLTFGVCAIHSGWKI
eukprot:TRINITY_DN9594_c0_g1_i1.p1 TRINITY_DN9594_c0_g1~~TRINITY_DN9594_c0_g1_i1.p1  ORF type:complete len:310 (+),score=80.73 TRINITY_DN9594_c0_g1_i1:3-932(+)